MVSRLGTGVDGLSAGGSAALVSAILRFSVFWHLRWELSCSGTHIKVTAELGSPLLDCPHLLHCLL